MAWISPLVLPALFACLAASAAMAAGPDGAWVPLSWSATGPVGYDGVSATFDSRRGRLLAVGGSWTNTYHTYDVRYSGDTWEFVLRGSGGWTTVAMPDTGAPMERELGAVAYDSLADVAWAFGGARQISAYPSPYVLYDPGLWRLDLSAPSPAWQRVAVTGAAPAGRIGASLTFDPARRELVLFGGRGADGHALADAWTFAVDSGTAWSALSPTGAPPAARAFHAAILDPSRSRLVVVGGQDESAASLADAWALDLAAPAWAPVAATGSFAGGICAGAYDPRDDRMLVLAGAGAITTYELALAPQPAWRTLNPQGTPPPILHAHYAAVMDPVGHELVDLGSDYHGVFPGTSSYALPHALYLDGAPVVTLAATMWPSYLQGRTTLHWAITTSRDLYGSVSVERMDPGGPTLKQIGSPDANDSLFTTDDDLHAGEHHDYRLSWYDGAMTQTTALFGVDTPPAPTQLHVSLDYLRPLANGIDMRWSVPDDSAAWLAPTLVEQSVADSAFRPIGYVYPDAGKLRHTAYRIPPQTEAAFRLRWGPNGEYASAADSIVTPPVPVFVGAAANNDGAVLEWQYPAGQPLRAYLFTAPLLGDSAPVDSVDADAAGLLRFTETAVAPNTTVDYVLAWWVGGQLADLDPVAVPVWDQRLDLLRVIEADSSGVALRWYYPDADSLRSMVLERHDGATWDSLAALPSSFLPGQRRVEDHAVVNDSTYEYRVRWAQGGIALHSHARLVHVPSAPDTAAGPGAAPALVAAAANAAGAVVDWRVDPGTPFTGYVYPSVSGVGVPIDTVAADAGGRIHFEGPGLANRTNATYVLAWNAGGTMAFGDPVNLPVGTERVDLLGLAAADTAAVTLSWDYPTADDSRSLVLERRTGASWDSLAALGVAVPIVQRHVADTGVTRGATYAYRLRWAEGGVELHSQALSVNVPLTATVRLAMGRPSPNPVRGAFDCALTVPLGEAATLGLFDISGRRVRSIAVPFTGASTVHVPVQGLPAGLYLARLSTRTASHVERIVVLP